MAIADPLAGTPSRLGHAVVVGEGHAPVVAVLAPAVKHRRSHDAPSSGTVTKITTPGADSAAGKTCSNATPGRFAARRPAEMIKSRQGRLRQLAIALPAASANTKVALPSARVGRGAHMPRETLRRRWGRVGVAWLEEPQLEVVGDRLPNLVERRRRTVLM
jgi:hypothetical protein